MRPALEHDVLIIGAGPAGSSAAIVLSRAGLDVCLVDRETFPRDKTCGDALLPDAIEALTRLGLMDRLADRAVRLETLRIGSPNRTTVDIPGTFAALERSVLDDVLRIAAVEAGARFLAPLKALSPIERDGRIVGATLTDPGGARSIEIHARYTVLATGASAGPLQAFGVRAAVKPEAFALRAYFEAPAAIASEMQRLSIAYDRVICPGYGWIFALPGNVFNVGVGLVSRHVPRGRRHPLREAWGRFTEGYPEARTLVRESRPFGPVAGAPLRTGFDGTKIGRAGLLVVGEAAGLTYPFTGEGIGKAMESGRLAARALLDALGANGPDRGSVEARYLAASRAAFADRFATYRRAEAWVARPWICNLLCRRARRDGFVRRQIAGMIGETTNPTALFSPLGLLRTIIG